MPQAQRTVAAYVLYFV